MIIMQLAKQRAGQHGHSFWNVATPGLNITSFISMVLIATEEGS